MPYALSKARRRALRDDGWTRRDIEDLEARLGEVEDDDADDDEPKRSRSSRRSSNGDDGPGRVSVFEGKAAERVLAKLGLDDEDGEDEDDDDERDDDDKPRARPKAKAKRGYFE